MEVEGIHRAHERHVAVADEFHQGEAGAEVFAGDADDQTQVGGDDLVFHVRDPAANGFEEIWEVAGAGGLGFDFSTGDYEFEFVKVEFQEECALAGRGKERRAIEILQIGGKIARDAGFFAFDVSREFFLCDDLVDYCGGVFLMIEGIIDELCSSATELG